MVAPPGDRPARRARPVVRNGTHRAGAGPLTALVFRLTSDSLGAPVALLLTGLLLLGMGAVVLIRRRTAEQP